VYLLLFIAQAVANNPAPMIIQHPSVFCSPNREFDLTFDELQKLKALDLDVPLGMLNQTSEEYRMTSEADFGSSSFT